VTRLNPCFKAVGLVDRDNQFADQCGSSNERMNEDEYKRKFKRKRRLLMGYKSSTEQARALTRSYRFLGQRPTPSGCSRRVGYETGHCSSGKWKTAPLSCCIFGSNPCIGLGIMDGGCSAQFNGGDDTHDPCLALALMMLGPGDVRGIKGAPSRPGKHMANLPRLHLSSRISSSSVARTAVP